jgi:hypothetical protein
VSAVQGKITVLIAVVVTTALLLHSAATTGNWVGFLDTEVQLLVAMAVSWWVLTGSAPEKS